MADENRKPDLLARQRFREAIEAVDTKDQDALFEEILGRITKDQKFLRQHNLDGNADEFTVIDAAPLGEAKLRAKIAELFPNKKTAPTEKDIQKFMKDNPDEVEAKTKQAFNEQQNYFRDSNPKDGKIVIPEILQQEIDHLRKTFPEKMKELEKAAELSAEDAKDPSKLLPELQKQFDASRAG